jgi:hypothetical protein
MLEAGLTSITMIQRGRTGESCGLSASSDYISGATDMASIAVFPIENFKKWADRK